MVIKDSFQATPRLGCRYRWTRCVHVLCYAMIHAVRRVSPSQALFSREQDELLADDASKRQVEGIDHWSIQHLYTASLCGNIEIFNRLTKMYPQASPSPLPGSNMSATRSSVALLFPEWEPRVCFLLRYADRRQRVVAT